MKRGMEPISPWVYGARDRRATVSRVPCFRIRINAKRQPIPRGSCLMNRKGITSVAFATGVRYWPVALIFECPLYGRDRAKRKSCATNRAERTGSARLDQRSTCSAMARASSTSMPRYRTVLSILVWPSKKLHGSQVASPTIDQGRFCSSQRMGAEQVRVDAGNPLRHTPSVLPRSHTPFLPSAGCEQELAGLLTRRPDVVVHRLAGLFRQFEPDRPPGLFLAYGRAIAGITIRRNVLDPESDDIAASQLAVDGQIEHR